jgi:hypothetical protein
MGWDVSFVCECIVSLERPVEGPRAG